SAGPLRVTLDCMLRYHDVDACAALQQGVHHRTELVHTASEWGQDPLDRISESLLGVEADLCALDAAPALDVDAIVPVHHHLLDRRVGEQLLERAEADRLAQDQLDETCSRRPLEET